MDKNATYSAVLGVVLANLRAQKGLEQGDIADKMGLSQASYSRLENGKSAFSIDQMYQAASALGMSGNQIINEVDRYSSHLQSDGVHVIPQIRGNTSKAAQNKSRNDVVPSFVAGAALGALIMTILSKK